MAGAEAILEGLNAEQRVAAAAASGPVAILAGAGTGKTTTITHRIAYQVESDAFPAERILAVTFTEKAAGELKARLAALGVPGVEARTFHAAALAQLGRLWERHTGTPMPQILDAKAPLISSLANALPAPHRFVPRRELAGEIEWAKVRMVSAERYLDSLRDGEDGHVPPIPAELMARVYQGYERRKRAIGRFDFEDMLGLAVRLFDRHPEAAEAVRARYLAFTVDEYQDVNPLQQELLDRWLGGREELCVVGDDYQTIYTFAGASPSYLLGFGRRYANARIVRLEANYRSTPQILATANRLAPRLGGFEKVLRATRSPGPEPVVRPARGAEAEVAFVVEEARRLNEAEGVAYEEMAVVYRINARSEEFEEGFADAGIPYQVRDGAFLARPGARSVLARLRRDGGSRGGGSGGVAAIVEAATAAVGYDQDAEPDSPEEATRQADLGRLRALAAEFEGARPEDGIDAFEAELRRRFSAEAAGRGVNLLTYHRAKGLEFDAVFLPRLVDRELPFRSGRRTSDEAEERRLLYVGITRARRHLTLTWPQDARYGRSPFLAELGVADRPPAPTAGAARGAANGAPTATADHPSLAALKRWRLERSRRDGVPAYVVFHDATLAQIAEESPRSLAGLASIRGVGPTKLDRYGEEVLAVLTAAD